MKFAQVTGSPAAALIVAVLFSNACGHSGLPDPHSQQYREVVSAFSVGLAALQGGDDARAQEKLQLSTKIAPGEPAIWADLGLLSARQQDFDAAYNNVEHARSLMPENTGIEALLGLIEDRRGKLPAAIGHLQKAVQLDSRNVKAQFSLAEETEREGKPSSDAEAEKLFARLLAQRPDNLAVLLEVARLAAKTGDGAALQSAVGKLTEASAAWPAEVKDQMNLLTEAAGSNPRAAAVRVMYLRNTLARVRGYRQSLNEVKTPSTFVSDPFLHFLKLPVPTSVPAPPDLAMHFDAKPLDGAPASPVLWVGAIPLDDKGAASVLWANQTTVQIVGGAKLRFPGGNAATIGRNAILGADLNYDFRTDLIFAGAGGLAFYEQQDLNHFTDITQRTHLPASVLQGSYTGAWAFDVDLDGDLDIVLGENDGQPTVLRNNGDETFTVMHPFEGVNGVKAFASADIEGDGDPDIAIVDGDGRLHVFLNQRLGQYQPRSSLSGRYLAVATADAKKDGLLDFVLLGEDGAVTRLSDGAALARSDPGGSPTLVIADFDNNGSLDYLVGDGQIVLGDKKIVASVVSASAVDLNGDGLLDLVGLDTAGHPVELLNRGIRNYGWQDIRVRAAKATGDQRINSFGIGGEIEVRAGLLTQKQPIASQLVHFGLGYGSQVDVARITWPNGVVQGEFELKANQEILATQRLKGSCPWLFAWDGKQMSFVKDGSPWSAALGLHINAQVVAGIQQTEEWFKIPGESLKPRDGFYDLRITDELWETYYIDHYSLMVVDHPEGTEVYTDERFAVPPPPLRVYTTAEPQPFAGAHDDGGADVSAIVRDVDRKYLDNFGRGPYQGLTRDHWVELELPASAPRTGPLYLLATGWVHPTDATVNIAIGQNSIAQPQGLSIETPDAHGKWIAAKTGLGFPAGKMKTVVLDLGGVFHPGAPRKLRVRTNLEIYWDQLAWAAGAPDRNRTQRLSLSTAELRYRGFSAVKAANPSSPELPDYNKIASTGAIWHDLEGYATRFGDVRELLEKVDDRMVIANAGDELMLRFRAPDPPPAGWKRDYIMVGNGWIKDGDFNSVYSKTVLPLPYRGMKTYDAPPGALENDPAYKRHPDDWLNFHTRYVTPEAFERALRN